MFSFYSIRRLFLRKNTVLKIFSRKKLQIGVIGVPFSRGQVKSGVEKAPQALRKAGLINIITQMGHDVKDYGNIGCNEKNIPSYPGEIHSNMEWLPQVALCTEKVSLKAMEIIIKERVLLTLGGDHSVALGSVDGHIKAKEGNICIIWVDAHPDLNTADTSPSGNLHGMTAALLVKEMSHFWPYLPGLDWQKPMISIDRLAYIGLRSIDTDERVILDKFGVTAFGMSDIEKSGIHKVTEEAIQKINPAGDRSIHISFDIDALDPLEAPSTGTPVRGGLTLREALIIVETIQKTNLLTAMDLVEINPQIGSEYQGNLTVEAAMHIIKAAFQYSRSAAHPVKHKVYPHASFTPLENEPNYFSDDTDVPNSKAESTANNIFTSEEEITTSEENINSKALITQLKEINEMNQVNDTNHRKLDLTKDSLTNEKSTPNSDSIKPEISDLKGRKNKDQSTHPSEVPPES